LTLASHSKAHLHIHSERAIRSETILDLYRRQGGAQASLTLDEVRRRGQTTPEDTSVGYFLDRFAFILGCQDDLEDLVRIAREAVEDAHADGVRCPSHVLKPTRNPALSHSSHSSQSHPWPSGGSLPPRAASVLATRQRRARSGGLRQSHH